MTTRSLNLDGMFQPTSFPEIEFKMLKFSGGELHIKLNQGIDYSVIDKVVITNRITNSDDLMSILFAVDALRRIGIKSFDLVMPYIPYARQDRYEIIGESLTLKVFTGIINSVGFDRVYVFDSHSDVATALIDNCVNIPNNQYVKAAIDMIKTPIYLVSPDSGANKKINKLSEYLTSQYKLSITINPIQGVIKCDKIRNMGTGELSDFTVFADDLKGVNCLICDDLVDGGRTFIGVAKALREKNCGNVYLFVSHGIFSYGFDGLLSYINTIYTTNSFNDVKNEEVLNKGLVKQFKFEL